MIEKMRKRLDMSGQDLSDLYEPGQITEEQLQKLWETDKKNCTGALLKHPGE